MQVFELPPQWFSLSIASFSYAAVLTCLFVIGLFIGSKVLPGSRVTLEDTEGNTRTTKLNGLLLFILTLLSLGLLQYFELFSLSVVIDHFVGLFLVANILALVVSIGLYWNDSNNEEKSSGFWRGFLLGRQLNPTFFNIDLKIFSYRPSLISLAVINLSFGVTQYEIYGELSLAMVLYQTFTLVYVLNYFQFEIGMVHTWDIVSERFGVMLVWGNLVLVPFFYSITGWWLIHATVDLSPIQAALLILLYVTSFWMFRGSNQQKHDFKQKPQSKIWGRPVETLDGRLLVSGFWGVGRHLNYTGEIGVYLAFTMTVGLNSLLPYLLLVWLIGLLTHRAWRDERRCSMKYGDLWEGYKRRARFAMVPYVY